MLSNKTALAGDVAGDVVVASDVVVVGVVVAGDVVVAGVVEVVTSGAVVVPSET